MFCTINLLSSVGVYFTAWVVATVHFFYFFFALHQYFGTLELNGWGGWEANSKKMPPKWNLIQRYMSTGLIHFSKLPSSGAQGVAWIPTIRDGPQKFCCLRQILFSPQRRHTAEILCGTYWDIFISCSGVCVCVHTHAHTHAIGVIAMV